jgi:hypothetical protein
MRDHASTVYGFLAQLDRVDHFRQTLDANAGLSSRAHSFQTGLGDPAVVAAPAGACDGGLG